MAKSSRAARPSVGSSAAETRRVRAPRRALLRLSNADENADQNADQYARSINVAQQNPRWRASARASLVADLALLREQGAARDLLAAARAAVMRLGEQLDRYAATWQAKGYPPASDGNGHGARMWNAVMEQGPSRYGPGWSIESGFYVVSAETEFVGRASQWLTDDDLIAEVVDPVGYRKGRLASLRRIQNRRAEYVHFVACRNADRAAHDEAVAAHIKAVAEGDDAGLAAALAAIAAADERMRRPPPKARAS